MMCYLLPLLLMLGTALLTWLASRSSIRYKLERAYEDKQVEAEERYTLLSNEYISYVEKQKQNESNYASYKSDYDAVVADRGNWKTKYTNLFVESEQQMKEYQASLSHWEAKFKQAENEQAEALQTKDAHILSWSNKFTNLESEMIVAQTSLVATAPVEKIVERIVEVPVDVIREVEVIKEVERIVEVPVDVIREVEVIKEVERIVEVIKEIEVIREVPVEIIREIEVTKEIDMESLMAMFAQMGTVEVSRTVRDAEVAEPIIEAAVAVKEERTDDLTLIEGIGPKIAELLNKEGIVAFKQLAITEISYLKILLERAGSRFQMHKPDTWPEQARLAAEGKFDELKAWQDELNGGKK